MNNPNIGAKVLAELANLAKTSSLSINELRIVLAIERLVARLTSDRILSDKLVFKGGYVLLKTINSLRFTRDIDATAVGIPREVVSELISIAIKVDLNDGVFFGPIESEGLPNQGDYGGLRIKVPFQIGGFELDIKKLKKLSRLHLDIGFGDSFTMAKKEIGLKPLLKISPPVSWRVYALESIFAEKLETIVSRGSANSRGKDIYDLVTLYPLILDKKELKKQIKNTFENRSTKMPESFSEFISKLDTTILKLSWQSIDVEERVLFEECFSKLIDIVKEVDV